jgi:UDP-2,3-diacylglucosamine hydrolase
LETAAPAFPILDVPGPALFVSDLHLTDTMPATAQAFERFLRDIAPGARALFILGDFFEFWVGDEELDAPFHHRVAGWLHTLSQAGTTVYLMHGNRDFLLGQRFANAAGATLLRDPTVLQCEGARIVLTHGDMLCTDDAKYMRFRNWTRKRWVQRLFLALPLSLRLSVARKLRADSEAGRARVAQGGMTDIGDVAASAVAALFRASGCRRMIHGHTHRPKHHHEPDGERWVLTDWDLDGTAPRAAALRLDAGGLHTLPLAA